MSDPTAPAQPVSHTKRPVAVDAHTPIPPPNVAVIIVTWNRAAMVCDVIAALARQRFPRSAIDAVVVDNASTDGTAELLVERWGAERIVPNPTQHAHEPAFAEPTPTGRGPNRAGLRSLTVVRNAHNLGGCGGFNTGFAYVQHAFDVPDSPTPPDYVWLVDDDIDLPDDAAQRLVEAATNDPSIGLVGSRTVDIRNRDTTIETTVYFDRRTGLMTDNAPPGHPRHDEHKAWAERVGGTKGRREYSGLRDVDVVSACSLLARWSAVREVGFWDWRYFIYCDDADWCLRFARAGRRVVLNLDAVVYHTPWHHKLTPARLYYAQRNILWVLQKILPPRELRRVTLRRLAGLMKDSLVAATHRRLFHAEIIRRTADDACRGRAGKLDFEGPPTEPLMDALEPIPYTTMNTMLDAGFPRGALNYWKSSFLPALSAEAIDTMIERFEACPSPMSGLLLEHFHGAATRVPVSATAFPHRSAGYNLLVASEWLDPVQSDRNIQWARDTFEAMRPHMAPGRYVNYLGEDEGDDPAAEAYGENYERLRQIKRQYDPENVFHLNQNIRPST